ncbi:hypothetical protein PSHT_06187 [Puccinia striiformis]|uniref:Uncharacterized protein n=1 Tax=Puccinia striiformis TaxID=27350 RepID=A0A2S4W8P0_9BASI|nr:hypothetical protein PSHT_06187 [Puccinia striiformis]
MSRLAKFKPTILSVKTPSSASLTPTVILSIIYHFKLTLPKENLIYTYFPRDSLTDWFRGYGFLHFQPSSSSTSIPGKDERKEEQDRFSIIKHHPVQEIRILNNNHPSPSSDDDNPQPIDNNQIQFSSFLDLSDHHQRRGGGGDSIFSPNSIKCIIEFSQSNLNSTGIQSRQTNNQSHCNRPKLSPDQFSLFTQAFHDFGGFNNSLRLKRPPPTRPSKLS